ncbi:MAG: acetate uptake transporter [Armatimonadetes bacterium]|nr:acetate uptake transporter [Armatimonadota bacterium]
MARIPADIEDAGPVEQAATGAAVANPAPLGLCAFALTTFVLSAANAKLFDGDAIVLGLAYFYGGLAQLCAGMWEFRTGNTFGATAFSSYGAFWLAFAFTVQFHLVPNDTALGFFRLGWTIFTGLMFVATLRLNLALMTLFFLLFLTFLFLTLGAFGLGNGQMIGGYLGIATALVAWYTALAGLLSSMPSAFKLPVGPRS